MIGKVGMFTKKLYRGKYIISYKIPCEKSLKRKLSFSGTKRSLTYLTTKEIIV